MSDLRKVKTYRGFIIARHEGSNDSFFVFTNYSWSMRNCIALFPRFQSVVACERYVDTAISRAESVN